jgi:hypothetical protein
MKFTLDLRKLNKLNEQEDKERIMGLYYDLLNRQDENRPSYLSILSTLKSSGYIIESEVEEKKEKLLKS